MNATTTPTANGTHQSGPRPITPLLPPTVRRWMMDGLPELITARMVGLLLSVSVRTVWRMTEHNELPPPIRRNRKWVRWSSRDILAAVEAMRDQASY